MRDRNLNLNVRIDADELAKLHALAEDRDLSASTLVRHWLREAYAARFGAALPSNTPTAKKKTGRR